MQVCLELSYTLLTPTRKYFSEWLNLSRRDWSYCAGPWYEGTSCTEHCHARHLAQCPSCTCAGPLAWSRLPSWVPGLQYLPGYLGGKHRLPCHLCGDPLWHCEALSKERPTMLLKVWLTHVCCMWCTTVRRMWLPTEMDLGSETWFVASWKVLTDAPTGWYIFQCTYAMPFTIHAHSLWESWHF